MLGLGVGVINAKVTAVDPEKLREWLDGIPETAREKEPANILAFIFFVELLKEKEKEKKVEGVDINAWRNSEYKTDEESHQSL